MKYFFPLFISLFLSFPLFSQEEDFSTVEAPQQEELKPFSLEADYFYGTILEHNPDISHLITGHPTGFILSYNRKTYGFNEWERRYRFPDWGFTVAYQNMHNEFLGENIGVYGHYNWYFYNRHLVIRLGQGIAYAEKPYDAETNYQNNAYGSRFLSTTFLKMNYVRENVWRGFGFHAGFGIIHYSNANFRAPNNSTNTFAFNAGISYQVDHEKFPEYNKTPDSLSSTHAERVKYNFVFRAGLNESDVIGQGQYPFYVASVFADKRINYKSTLQAGVDVYFSNFLKELIYYRSVAYSELGLSGDEDYKRVGVFVGHELRFNRVAFVSQLGYYVYYPFEFENRVYNRLGLKRYFFNDQFFAAATVHAHWAKAEAVEFSVGIRL
ncbi:acyloxyacyl hydrolase [Aequorivita echinoideorum]|uniref:Acyloxyacyl hydrolase n=1 Tax=Aequorivita echinoideorum TaxID=1549647 RepID=A0ABS5S0D1_9FLAO|nr:acyloxyacyl hydrolase [Aequorivita echinoideorum]MBT0606662.1 acyloxyacyl hydrolase [Aequorivita echinoideorum]